MVPNICSPGLELSDQQDSIGSLPPDLASKMDSIDQALVQHPHFEGGLHAGRDKLREFVTWTSREAEAVEAEGNYSQHLPPALFYAEVQLLVDTVLKRGRLDSPEGTFYISREALLEFQDKPLHQKALLHRILRYVSPKPWGSLRAQGNRRSQRLSEMSTRLMDSLSGREFPSAFAMGSQVLWKPVIRPSKPMRGQEKRKSLLGWMACRQPPDSIGLESTKDKDITSLVLDASRTWESGESIKTLEILWDCRFLVKINLEKMPKWAISALAEGGKLQIRCDEAWFHPYIILHTGERESVLSDALQPKADKKKKPKAVDWIDVKFIRTLSSV